MPMVLMNAFFMDSGCQFGKLPRLTSKLAILLS